MSQICRLLLAITIPVVLMAAIAVCNPSTQQVHVAEGVAKVVVDDACSEVEDAGAAPEWIVVACDGVSVLLPRKSWALLKTDAGPGK